MWNELEQILHLSCGLVIETDCVFFAVCAETLNWKYSNSEIVNFCHRNGDSTGKISNARNN